MPRVCVAAVLLVALAGCHSGGKGKPGTAHTAMKAAKDFMTFAHTSDSAPPADDTAAPPPKVVVLARRVLDPQGRRPRVDLEISLPLQARHQDVVAILEAAARGPDAAGFSVVRVRAFPGTLTHLVGPAGTLVLADDGKGWDGSGTKDRRSESVSKRLGGTFTVDELKALTAVDRALATGAKLDRAEAEAATRTHQSPDAVAAAVARARQVWPEP